MVFTTRYITIAGLIVVFLLLIFAMIVKMSDKDRTYKKNKEGKFIDNKINDIKNSNFVNSFERFSNKKTELLIRKAKNPWNLTPAVYYFIRYFLAGCLVVLGIILLPITSLSISIFVFIAALMCYIIPYSKYKEAANKREQQWNQLYAYFWVLKHNSMYYNPEKVFLETATFIENQTDSLPEIVTGLRDFAAHWDGKTKDSYIKENYDVFIIPSRLFSIFIQNAQTGENPETQLSSLRQSVLQNMDFQVNNVLSRVGTKATSITTPILLISAGLTILTPTLINISGML